MHLPLIISLGLANLTQFITNFNGTHTLEVNKFIVESRFLEATNMHETHHIFDELNLTTCKLIDNNLGLSLYKTELDWRKEKVVSSVKDQKNSGNCWSFSITGAVESAYAIHNKKLETFSVQDIIDCSIKSDVNDYDYIRENGICNELDIPYGRKINALCDNYCKNKVYISQCNTIPIGNQKLMMRYIQRQPLAAAIQVDSLIFKFYKSGVITSELCGQDVNHGVLIVGYGTEDGIDYWLVKNSWGTDWGDNGYVKIMRSNSVSDKGVCGIGSRVSFPSL